MTILKLTPADSILVAIDVSRQRNDVLIEVPGISRHHRLVVLNSALATASPYALLRNLNRGERRLAGREPAAKSTESFGALLVQAKDRGLSRGLARQVFNEPNNAMPKLRASDSRE